MASTRFDEEGVATRSRAVVRDGVVESYFLGSYSARKLGMTKHRERRRPPQSYLSVQRPRLRRHAEETPPGLLVTELMGQGVNLVTGDYSPGAAGYWVEVGENPLPVEEVTVAGNLKDMFRGIVAVGSDVLVGAGPGRAVRSWLKT